MSDSLPHVNLPFCGLDPSVEDFETEPLAGLCALPAHHMTEQQMRDHVMQIQQHRQSFQTWKAETEEFERVERSEKVVRAKTEGKKDKILKELDELF